LAAAIQPRLGAMNTNTKSLVHNLRRLVPEALIQVLFPFCRDDLRLCSPTQYWMCAQSHRLSIST
jgi:hypothetical protein